jgi:plasmid stabilization system protein ParE
VIPFEFHPDAAAEYDKAAAYLESAAPGMGGEFRREVESTIQFICRFPGAGRLNPRHSARSRVVQRFRYVIHYALEGNHIVIYSVAHGRRQPNYWASRLENP